MTSHAADTQERPLPLIEHVAELRRRLIVSSIAVLVCAAGALFFSPHIYRWLAGPLRLALPPSSTFITLSPVEGWLVYFKVSLLAALFASSPVWLYQLWAFAAPGLYRRERRILVLLGCASSLLFVGGALVCYYLIMPYGFRYFVTVLNGADIVVMPQMSLYFSFMLRLLIAFGLVFELPLVVVLLVLLNIVSLAAMKKARPYVIISAFVVAAVITPPDVFTQIALAIPFILLFEISLLVAWLIQRRGSSERC